MQSSCGMSVGSGASAHVQAVKYRSELDAERSLSDERLQDIRKLQRQLNELRNMGAAPVSRGKEDELRKIILDERRRADTEHQVANERLEDIRQLQTQVSSLRSAQSGAQDMSLVLRQSDAQVQTLAQREQVLRAELQRERSVREQLEHATRSKDHDTVTVKKELDILKDQYRTELSRHQLELEAWERERTDFTEREEELSSKLRVKQEAQHLELVSSIDQGKEREDRLRHAADKEWGVAEERLNEIRELQRQITVMHAKLTATHKQASEEKVHMQQSYRKEIETIKNQFASHRESIVKQLDEERGLSSERQMTIRTLERQLKDLNEQLVAGPGDDTRFREMQKQTDASLALYRADMDELRRAHRAENKEYEKKLSAERQLSEDRLNEATSVQRAAAEERITHKQVLEANEAEVENMRTQFKKNEDLLKARYAEKEEVLRRQIDLEKETADGRLKELQGLRRQLQELHEEHTKELAQQHKTREQMAIEARSREEEARRTVDEMMAARERSLQERERALLAEKEDALGSALRQAAAQEDGIRKECDEKVKSLGAKHAEELEYKAAEEGRRLAELERTHTAQMASAKTRMQREADAASAVKDQLGRAQREVEALRHEVAAQKIEASRKEEEHGRNVDMVQREFEEQFEVRRKEAAALQQQCETAQAHSAVVSTKQLEAESQLAALESELARHVGTISVQKEEIQSQAADLAAHMSEKTALAAENGEYKKSTKLLAESTEGMKPEMAKLAADNCKLKIENTKLQEREARLRHWAERTVGQPGTPHTPLSRLH